MSEEIITPGLDLWRQTDIVNVEKLTRSRVTVIGVGGIGSPTVLALAKMGVTNITVYDDDVVDTHNIPNQFYRLADIGKPKVEALAEIVESYSGAKIVAKKEFYVAQPLSGIVISALDSMKARQIVWNGVKYKPNINIYIDGRMGAEVCQLHSVTATCERGAIERYEQTLYTDEEAQDLPCTAKSIIYTGLSIAGLIAGQVKKHVMGEEVLETIYFDHVTLTSVSS